MAKGIKICRVCGKEYEACHTLRPNLNSEFRWQDVACCPEHGTEYLRQVMIARGQLQEEPEAASLEEEVHAEEEVPTVPKRRRRRTAEAGSDGNE